MKKFLVLLMFNSIYTMANEQMIEDNCTSCKAIFPNTKENIVTKAPNISNEEIGAILENALKKIRLYKKEKNSEIKRLENIVKEFREYKIKKNREIKKLKSQLAIYKKKLSKSQEKLTSIQTDIMFVNMD